MTIDPSPLEAAVHSIYGFIERTAERTPTGITWETINSQNKPQHDISVFNGVGGISFFLVDYHKCFGNPFALELSKGAIEWCANYSGKHYNTRGIHTGQTGVALAALHRSIALDEPVSDLCHRNAKIILSESPGPVTDLLGGAASNGLYLLKLWRRTGTESYLRGAERGAEWLEQQMIRDEHGTHCMIDPSQTIGFRKLTHMGMAHGIAGIAYFLVLLAEATSEQRWADLARELFATLKRFEHPVHGGVNWLGFIGQEKITRCQWSHGAAGIGLAYLAAYRLFQESEYLETAVLAAEATYGYGDYRQNYTFCTGLAGSGELFIEVYRATVDLKWWERAIDFGQRCLAYKEETAEGDAWPTDAKGLYSADFVYGASGVGHFLLRLCSKEKIAMPLM